MKTTDKVGGSLFFEVFGLVRYLQLIAIDFFLLLLFFIFALSLHFGQVRGLAS